MDDVSDRGRVVLPPGLILLAKFLGSMTEVLGTHKEAESSYGSTTASQNATKDDLIEELDKLLERYLYTLDEYEKINKELSKQLSSVFHFSPAAS